MRTLPAFFLFYAFNVHASVVCKSIREYQLRLDAHTSNYKNADSTRTPEGGAYKYKWVSCDNGCRINETGVFNKRYDPRHVDADKSGHVTYPSINKEEEKALISTHANALILLAKSCPEKVKTSENSQKTGVYIKYLMGDVESDTINFSQSGSVRSMVRRPKDGKSTITNL